MVFFISERARAAGYRVAAFETVGSTSVEAMALAKAGETGPLWVVTDNQTDGRGRRGAAWRAPPGNLSASLLLTTDLPPSTLATLGFVAGVALARALDDCCASSPAPPAGESGRAERGRMRGHASALELSGPGRWGTREDTQVTADPSTVAASPRHLLPQGEKGNRAFRLKWPNDVLAKGGKLAGILLGTEDLRDERNGLKRAVVVGIGVNVLTAPEGLQHEAASLHDLGCPVSAETLFGALTSNWADAYAEWDGGRGFDAIRKSWLARAAGLGGPVAVRTGTTVTSGSFETIDAQGHLVIRVADGSAARVSAGEVHFGAAATIRPEACI